MGFFSDNPIAQGESYLDVLADLFLTKQNLDDFVLNSVCEQSPDIVGLSCMSFQYSSALRLAELIKMHYKNVLIVLGGYHPTLMFEEISNSRESRFFDFIVRGEGEATFNELVTAIRYGI